MSKAKWQNVLPRNWTPNGCLTRSLILCLEGMQKHANQDRTWMMPPHPPTLIIFLAIVHDTSSKNELWSTRLYQLTAGQCRKKKEGLETWTFTYKIMLPIQDTEVSSITYGTHCHNTGGWLPGWEIRQVYMRRKSIKSYQVWLLNWTAASKRCLGQARGKKSASRAWKASWKASDWLLCASGMLGFRRFLQWGKRLHIPQTHTMLLIVHIQLWSIMHTCVNPMLEGLRLTHTGSSN